VARRAAVEASGSISQCAQETVHSLVRLLKGHRVRQAASLAPGGIGGSAKDAVPALVEVLEGGNSGTHAASAWALGELRLDT
jgi:HEAT repeat protein